MSEAVAIAGRLITLSIIESIDEDQEKFKANHDAFYVLRVSPYADQPLFFVFVGGGDGDGLLFAYTKSVRHLRSKPPTVRYIYIY